MATVRYRCAPSELRYALTWLRLILKLKAHLSADGVGEPLIRALPVFSAGAEAKAGSLGAP